LLAEPSPARESAARFHLLHAGLPALLALLVLGTFESTNLDVRIENLFYDPIERRFPYHVHYFFETVIHDFGRLSIILIGAALVAGAVWSYRRTALRRYRRGLLYAALCLAVAPATVAQIKHNSVIHCPRDLAQYNGDQPYVRLFDPVPDGVEPGHCWPGGHSSGGFALMALYFVFRRTHRRLALAWLAGGFVYGFALGFGRVVQGAHFVSHNLWAALVCWAVALVLYELILRRDPTPPPG
jgi:membrane-associated PAP2 superfamily phosphatase